MDVSKVVSRNLLRLRQQRGMSQIDLSEAAGMTHARVSGVERGRANPTIKTLFRLALALGVEPAELLAFDETERREMARLARPRK